MPPTQEAELFSAEFLRRLESLHLLARKLTRGRTHAERRSRKRGSGIEFADYRPFSSGDDWRSIDWNAFARTRHLMLKLFEEEEDLYVYLLLDCSASMGWGTPSKFSHARQLAAGLAFLALANLDRVAIVPLAPGSPKVWHPARGRGRFLALLRYLEELRTVPTPVSMAETVHRWTVSQPRRGLAIWITDLWGHDLNDAAQTLDRLRYTRHELSLIQVANPKELTIPESGEFELEEMETGARLPVIADAKARTEYEQSCRAYLENIRRACTRSSIPFLQASTETPVEDILTRSLIMGGFAR